MPVYKMLHDLVSKDQEEFWMEEDADRVFMVRVRHEWKSGGQKCSREDGFFILAKKYGDAVNIAVDWINTNCGDIAYSFDYCVDFKVTAFPYQSWILAQLPDGE